MLFKSSFKIKSDNYINPNILKEEKSLLFKEKFLYLGSASKLKNNEFRLIKSLGHEKILSLEKQGPVLLDNSCSHRHARILKEDKSGQDIRCPIHNWSFNCEGKCISVPMASNVNKEPLGLKRTNVSRFGDLLFGGEIGTKVVEVLSSLQSLEKLNLKNMVHSSRETETINCNWKNYIEIFAENYHVPFVHPGFSKIVDLHNLKWIRQPEYCVQLFTMNPDFEKASRTTTPQYRNWLQALHHYYHGQMPEVFGSLILFYPNLIIETYPLTTAVGWIEPTGVNQFTYTVDYYHDREMLVSNPEIANLAKLALDQTEQEDKSIAEDLAQGRMNDSTSDQESILVGNLEVGIDAFYEYYANLMKGAA